MSRWFPELELFDEADRDSAFANAREQIVGGRRRWVFVVASILTPAVVCAVAAVLLKVHFWCRVTWEIGFLAGLSSFVAMIAANYVFRRPIQRELRRLLNEAGTPVCKACGHNLTGNTSGRCPECGTPCRPVGSGS